MTPSNYSLAAAALVVCLLAACASGPPPGPNTASVTAAPDTAPNAADIKRQAAFDKGQDSWTGAKVQELVAKLGPPSAKAKQPDGSPVYVYARSTKSGATTTFSCVVRYLFDARGERVTGHQIEGC